MADEKKIGAYICKGCGIEERLDVNQLVNTAKRDGKAAISKDHEFLCSADGVKMIQDDIDNDGVNRVVIVGCSRRAKTEAFSFEGVTLSRANIREGVIWVRPNNDEAQETTQEMADDYVRMACAEAKFLKVPSSSGEQELTKRIMVVGGGVSGLTSALEAAKTGYEVDLVEKSDRLGGIAAELYKRVPAKNGLQGPVDNTIGEMIAAVEGSDKITVHLSSAITKTEGAPGRFSVELAGGKSLSVGAIVQATGFKTYDMSLLPEFSPDNADVIDQLQFEQRVKANHGAIKKADGSEATNVVFVQCAGQRSDKEGHLPYCSGHCCTTSIKQAHYVRAAGGDATVIFDDLRTPGASGEDFYRSGQEAGVAFSKGEVSSVKVGKGLEVNYTDKILNEQSTIHADIVVLATGMVPNSGPNPYLELELGNAKDAKDEALVKQLEAEIAIQPAPILNLDYRQGSDLPHLKHGFNDSHFICFPYETRRTGIYASGPLRRPMDIAQTIEDATGATLKAIQACENAALGRAAHPRSGDLSFPTFRREGCTQCKRCTVECPFGAINEDEEKYPQYNEARCRRCGTCMGACPVRVISFENYSVDTVGQQIKNVDIPDEFEEKPRILVLACENDAYPALDMAGMTHQEYSSFARIIPIRCLGSVNTIWITDALNSGYDGVMLMGCQKGDNYQCHFVKGSEMAHYRMSKIDDTLSQLNLEKERVQTFEVSITDIERIPQLINDMEKTIGEIGMSPFKF
ncbi:hydrogenase iron-sulfur subunit [Ectothiorhodospiraceae bacterium BW-2]|nr:hydrogenase iron-sulfur subunit [Ectothiorhodospiraceae bacterium BW-2]